MKDRDKRKSILVDGEIHKRYSEYCKEKGYIIGLITGRLIEEWLNSKLETQSD